MSHAAALKRYNKALIQAEKHLLAAAQALAQMQRESNEAGIPVRGIDDTRVTLQGSCREYGHFLSAQIERLNKDAV